LAFQIISCTEENLKFLRIAALRIEISNCEFQNVKYECHPPSDALSSRLK